MSAFAGIHRINAALKQTEANIKAIEKAASGAHDPLDRLLERMKKLGVDKGYLGGVIANAQEGVKSGQLTEKAAIERVRLFVQALHHGLELESQDPNGSPDMRALARELQMFGLGGSLT